MRGLGLAAGLAAGVMEGKRAAELAKERKEDRAVMNDLRRARIDSLRGKTTPSASSSVPEPGMLNGYDAADLGGDMAGPGIDPRDEDINGMKDGGLVGGHPNASRTSIAWQSQSFKK